MSFGESIKSPNTVGLWHFNGNANDDSGNGLNGTNIGTVVYSKANGKFNEGAGSFNTYYSGVRIEDNANLDLTTFTVSVWFKVNSMWGGALVAKFKAGTSDVNYYIDTDGGSNRLRFIYSNGTQSVLTINKSLANNIWYNVIVTAGSGSIKAYINAELITQTTYQGTISTNAHPLIIGARKSADGMPYTYDSYLDGCIDEVIIENVIWNQQKIQKYYTNALGRFGIL